MWLKIMREKFFKNGQIYYGSFFYMENYFQKFQGSLWGRKTNMFRVSPEVWDNVVKITGLLEMVRYESLPPLLINCVIWDELLLWASVS